MFPTKHSKTQYFAALLAALTGVRLEPLPSLFLFHQQWYFSCNTEMKMHHNKFLTFPNTNRWCHIFIGLFFFSNSSVWSGAASFEKCLFQTLTFLVCVGKIVSSNQMCLFSSLESLAFSGLISICGLMLSMYRTSLISR